MARGRYLPPLVEVDEEGHVAAGMGADPGAAALRAAIARRRRQLLQPLAQHLLQILGALGTDDDWSGCCTQLSCP